MYDRLIRADMLESNRITDELHHDSHRWLFVALVLRADDFGNLEADPRQLARWAASFSQIDTPEAMLQAMQALADADLARRYEVDGRPYLHLPRFQNQRSYTCRQVPPSPWCDPEAATGRLRGADRSQVRVTRRSPERIAADLAAERARDAAHQATKSVEGKGSTKPESAPDLPQGCANVAPAQPPACAQAVHNSDPMTDQLHTPEPAPTLPQGCDTVAPTLTAGEVQVQRKDKREAHTTASQQESAGRASRLPTGWTIPADWAAWAITFAAEQTRPVTANQVQLVADSFRDYWHAKAGRDAAKLDWLATWRKWFRTELLEGRLSRRPPDPPAAGPGDIIRRAT